MSVDDFNAEAKTYATVVDRSIRFCNEDHAFFTRRKVDLLVQLVQRNIGDARSMRFLDVGCGVGTTDAYLAPRVGALHGIDVASDAVEVAKARTPRVNYDVYDGASLPYDDCSFDVSFAICVLHHVDPGSRPRFLSEMRRSVRRGGLVVVFEHNPYNPLTQVAVHQCPFDEDAVLVSRRECARILQATGLAVAEARYVIFAPFEHRSMPRFESWLRWLPLGAQHYVAARRT